MTESRTHDTAIGYLRSFVTVLVVAHHAVLSYHPFAPPPGPSLEASPWWRVFPVVDPERWSGFQWFNGWNDTFFMSLMFLLSGLFVWQSLQRKGSARFVRDRVVRLGLPWLVAIVLLSPLAYYPAFLQSGGSGFGEFWHQWLAAGSWPSGPAWFLLVLVGFDLIAAGVFALGVRRIRFPRHPVAIFAAILALSALAYLPLSHIVAPGSWFTFGPITFQTERILHYLVYFGVGVAVGAVGFDRTALARWWPGWLVAAAVAFWWAVHATIEAMTTQSSSWLWLAQTSFVLACAATCFAMMALFLRFAGRATPILDSLRDNAYGIYVIHYACVAWLQYALLTAPIPALAKGIVVTAGALALAWGASKVVRISVSSLRASRDRGSANHDRGRADPDRDSVDPTHSVDRDPKGHRESARGALRSGDAG